MTMLNYFNTFIITTDLNYKKEFTEQSPPFIINSPSVTFNNKIIKQIDSHLPDSYLSDSKQVLNDIFAVLTK